MGRHLKWQDAMRKPLSVGHKPRKSIAEAIADRDHFLEQYPQYQVYQNEIEAMLDKAGPPEKRMAVLAMLMESKLMEMHDQFKELNLILATVA
jgi:hypothetical protein